MNSLQRAVKLDKRIINKTAEQRLTTIDKRHKQLEDPSSESKGRQQQQLCSITEIEGSSFGNIKVTIKEKPTCSDSEKNRLSVLRSCFKALRGYAREKQRRREIKMNVQSIAASRNLRRCVRVWKAYVEEAKKARQEYAPVQNTDAYKIETLIDTITETQKELTKCQRAESQVPFATSAKDGGEARRRIPARSFVIESPAQSRLSAQKEIIRKQKMKLAEQSRMIEELKLRQVREEIIRSGEETVNAAKETITHCGQRTRRTLMQLMRQAGYRSCSYKIPREP